MKLFSKAAGVFATALLITGGVAPVAQGQALQVVTPEDQDAYVQQFHHEGDTPPVVDGVGGYTEQEVAEIHEAIRQAQDSGAPKEELIPGQMWSDKVELPATIDKAAADEAEIAIAQQQSQPQARTLAAAASCQTFWPSPHQVCGAILERYIQQGAQFGWMLLPTEGQALNPDGQGYRQRFMAGFIYWHPTTGAHAVNNYSAQVWERNGWESGWMGYPTGGEVPVSGSNPIDGELSGWVQTFQGGRVYRSPFLEGFQVASINGLILDKWLELGGPDSVLGFPIADEAKTADGVGRFSVFQHGSIYWHPDTGAFSVTQPVFSEWASAGYEQSNFGYPIADAVEEGDFVNQQFQYGSIEAPKYNPLMLLDYVPYIQFDSAILAEEFFDQVEQGLAQLPSGEITSSRAAELTMELAAQAGLKRYGPCELEIQNVHLRKSGSYGTIGFKPVTRCEGQVSNVIHESDLRYKWYTVWKKAPSVDGHVSIPSVQPESKKEYLERGLTHKYTTLDIVQPCVGKTSTSFIGVTMGTVVTATGTYYARAFSNPVREKCEIP